MIFKIMEFLFWLSVFLIGYSYILYPILLKLLAKIFKPHKPVLTEYLPDVSIIIAAYNEEMVIEDRIRNCLQLDYPEQKLEIIVASDGSNDSTAALVRKFSGRHVRLFDYQIRRGKVNVLNDTVPQTKHEIIVFTDANTL